jgi:hypothetical protein
LITLENDFKAFSVTILKWRDEWQFFKTASQKAYKIDVNIALQLVITNSWIYSGDLIIGYTYWKMNWKSSSNYFQNCSFKKTFPYSVAFSILVS